jgi:formylglycine-generating enzyme required for sulfatase activity
MKYLQPVFSIALSYFLMFGLGAKAPAQSPKTITNSIGMKLVLIPKGTFQMGSPPSDDRPKESKRELQHKVELTQDYYIGAFEVTQEQYKKVMGINPSHFQDEKLVERNPQTGQVLKEIDSSNHPVDCVSWKDAVVFCERLSELPEEEKAGRVYRLPTEAEWEYACRAGSKTAYSFGESSKSLGDYAWFGWDGGGLYDYIYRGNGNGNHQTHPVGEKKPNDWGIYDMHGNVSEWCLDWCGDYPNGLVTDPNGPKEGDYRVHRGGSFARNEPSCGSAFRNGSGPASNNSDLGFRVALSLSCKIPSREKDGKEITNSIGMKLVLIPKGTFEMGSPPSEKGSHDNERQHEVTINQDYYLGAFEVTQGQYKKIMGTNLSYFQGARVALRHPETGRVVKEIDSSNHPVDSVSWEDAVKFCKRLSELPEEKNAGRIYRLPTEAEWEFACRAGSKTRFCYGDSGKTLADYAWFGADYENYNLQGKGNSNNQSHPVGKKKANNWGLYDMHGNVEELCSDWFGETPKGSISNPYGPGEGRIPCRRGGSYEDEIKDCRSANRLSKYPSTNRTTGFRVALSFQSGSLRQAQP